MRMPVIRLPAALLILALWLLLTSGIILPNGTRGSGFFPQAASETIQLAWLSAALLAMGVAWSGDRRRMGLLAPERLASLRLVWLPLVYACALFAVGLALGPLAPGTMLILLMNMLLVGLSEELMFRSILFQGLLTHFRIWPAVLLTSLLFGATHTLNLFTTGDVNAAGMQAVTAFMQGLAYLAIRIRTGSVWPMAIVHGLWDFSLLQTALARPAPYAAHQEWSPLPILVTLPIFLYGLYLMRHLERDYRHLSMRTAQAPIS